MEGSFNLQPQCNYCEDDNKIICKDMSNAEQAKTAICRLIAENEIRVDNNFRELELVNCQINNLTPDFFEDIRHLEIRSTFRELKNLSSGLFRTLRNLNEISFCVRSDTEEGIFIGLPQTSILQVFRDDLDNSSENIFSNLNTLLELKLYDNYLENLSFGLRLLWLHENEMRLLPNQICRNFSLLTDLTLYLCKIENIHEDCFLGMKNLRTLIIQNNPITRLPGGVFRELNNLDCLNLIVSQNNITDLNPNCFAGLNNLLCIDLSKNKISTLWPNTFCNCPNLENLDLDNNRIEYVFSSALIDLKSLTVLHMRHNDIDSLPFGLFKNNIQLEVLDLESNNICCLRGTQLEGLRNLKELNLKNNRISTYNSKKFFKTS